jgi:hypothetical protein
VAGLASAQLAGAQPAPRSEHDAEIVEAASSFEHGRALMQAGKYAEACAAFAHSQELDPGWGTLYNLARCRELEGKLATALTLFRELARPDTYPPRPGKVPPERDRARRKDAGARASALDRRVPRLRLTSNEPPAGLAVTLDGVDVTGLIGTDQPVDPGVHQVHATAPAHKPFDATAEIRAEAATTTVVVALPPADPPRATPADEPPPAAPDPGTRGIAGATVPRPAADAPPLDSHPADEPAHPGRAPRTTIALLTGAAGGGLVVTGLVFGQLARSRWQSAQQQCGGGTICSNAGSLNEGVVGEARTRATISTVLVAGGAAAIGIAAYLYFTAPPRSASPSTALRLTPAAGSDTVALTLAGQF